MNHANDSQREFPLGITSYEKSRTKAADKDAQEERHSS
ncbi:hypothetical protein PQC44_gp106 [Escherichia phage IME267]|uniref:Uncharacterized protein n=1 Tax=Escherichia phage IME267 TaxID=2860374 RepID=A0AAE7WGL1_9CAUD|nr:hypothetical protein PQC44_gp106 [Escherichia phage IME267]QYC96988.1 hypothetical protein [Escherichia phage IME267]